MSKAIVVILALVAVALGVSISQGWINFKSKTNPTTPDGSSVDVNVNVDKSKFKSDMEAIRGKYKEWTSDTDTRLKDLQVKADKAEGDAKVKIQAEIDRLKAKKAELVQSLYLLRMASISLLNLLLSTLMLTSVEERSGVVALVVALKLIQPWLMLTPRATATNARMITIAFDMIRFPE